MALLEVEDLRVSFRTDDGVVKAVRGVSFQVDRAETLGIVGESGSGKSVATQTITGLTRGAEVHGRAIFDGSDLLRATRSELRAIRGPGIGMIFQDPLTSLHPAYRVGWQIEEMVRTHRSISRAESRRRAVEMLAERHAEAVRAHDLKVDQANLDDIAVTSKARNAARGVDESRSLA